MKTRAFVEKQFEDWFVRRAALPSGEKLEFLGQHKPIKAVVDLLFLDQEGGLVLLEVKNEPASIRSIGQVLEYLSQYEDIDLEGILDDLTDGDDGKKSELKLRFGSELPAISNKRRIVIAAPSFDYPTQAAVSLLNQRFKTADLELSLMQIAKRGRDEFLIKLVPSNSPKTVKQLEGKHGTNQRNRLFYVLPIEGANLLLNVGKISGDDLRVPKGKTATQRLVTRRGKKFLPYEGDHELVLDRQGTWWKNKNQERKAIILGETKGRNPLVYLAFDCALQNKPKFGIRTLSKFKQWFHKQVAAEVDWKQFLKKRFSSNQS
jgi:hypothetical protein